MCSAITGFMPSLIYVENFYLKGAKVDVHPSCNLWLKYLFEVIIMWIWGVGGQWNPIIWKVIVISVSIYFQYFVSLL